MKIRQSESSVEDTPIKQQCNGFRILEDIRLRFGKVSDKISNLILVVLGKQIDFVLHFCSYINLLINPYLLISLSRCYIFY